jgi:SAM-dependent methyltransferase
MSVHQQTTRPTDPVAWLPDLMALFEQQLREGEDEYLRAHSNSPSVVSGHLRCVGRYLRWVRGPVILDWGCYQGTDAWALRRALGEELELHGCDIWDHPPRRFHEASGLQYRQLADLYRLPYGTEQFDTVVGSGVIEHVVNPSESLKELHRILKTDGRLILTFAPNQTSLTEWILALVGGHGHPRRYTRGGLRRLLLDHGFLVEACGFHEITPTLTSGSVRWLWRMPGIQAMVSLLGRCSPWLDRAWPLNLLGQNLYIVGRRVRYVHG